MMQVLDAARKVGIQVFYACIVNIALATMRRGSTLRQFKRQRGRERSSNTARGAARFAASSRLNRTISWPSSIGAPAVSPTRLGFAAQETRHHKLIVMGLIAHTCVEASVRYAAELGYEVTIVKDATASYSEKEMHAALEVNLPNYASAIVTADEIVDSISSL